MRDKSLGELSSRTRANMGEQSFFRWNNWQYFEHPHENELVAITIRIIGITIRIMKIMNKVEYLEQ